MKQSFFLTFAIIVVDFVDFLRIAGAEDFDQHRLMRSQSFYRAPDRKRRDVLLFPHKVNANIPKVAMQSVAQRGNELLQRIKRSSAFAEVPASSGNLPSPNRADRTLAISLP